MLYIAVNTVYRKILEQKKVRNMLYDASHLHMAHWPFSIGCRIFWGIIAFILEFICFARLWAGVAAEWEGKCNLNIPQILELTDLTGPKYCACHEKRYLPRKSQTHYRLYLPQKNDVFCPNDYTCHGKHKAAYLNLAAGTASASSIASAVVLKRERLLLLFQNLKAGSGLEGEDTLFFPPSNYWYEKSTSPPAIQNLIRWGAALNIVSAAPLLLPTSLP